MSPITRTLTRDQLTAWGLPHDCLSEKDLSTDPDRAVELRCEQVETRRWVSVHQLIFRAPDDGKAWAVAYEQGLTECQDDTDPWNYDDTVTATLMEQYEATITQWREVDPERPAELTWQARADHAVSLYAKTAIERDDALARVAVLEQQAPAALTATERQFLTFALDLAADRMANRGDEFGADDEAALDTLRRIATGTPVVEEQQAWTLTRAHLDPFLRSLVSELDYDLHKSWERNEETGEDDYPTLVDQVADMLDAVTAAEEQQPATPAVGQRYTSRTHPDRTVTVNRVWQADDGHTAVAYEWRDDKPGQCGSACPLDVFHRAYRPADPS